jgi:hypothetical protein
MQIWLRVNIVKTLITQRKVKSNIMPTVKYKCPTSGKMKTKKFPYTATGKAQATSFSKKMGGSMKNNPGYGMEKKSY